MDTSIDKEYTLGDIRIYREVPLMNTNVIVDSNNIHYMYLYTVIKHNQLKQEEIMKIDFYDSPEEAIIQYRLNNPNTEAFKLVEILVNMTNTVFDKLSTRDINALEQFYNQYINSINKGYADRKNTKQTLDTYTINLFKQKKMPNIGVIRDVKSIKSDKHSLKCINKRKIMVYNIIDKNVVTKISYQYN